MIIGIGNAGCKLASSFTENPLLLSTAKEDTRNFVGENEVITFSEEGASKRFRNGLEIWNNNLEKLQKVLSNIKDDRVVIFSSLGGGSGSSSLFNVSKILLTNNNKVLVIGILPYKAELNPALSNAVQSINNLMPLIPKISIMLFDNEVLRKQYENNWVNINRHIVKRVDYILNLLSKYSSNEYSPLTLDESELESVIFGGGFVDYSETFIEEELPKFQYGNLDKTTKNCLVAMFVIKGKLENIENYHKIFTTVLDTISRRVPNARMIPGIIRGVINHSNSKEGIKDRAYITIASGLDINRYMKRIEKLRDIATKKALIYSEEYKGEKFVDTKDIKVLDI